MTATILCVEDEPEIRQYLVEELFDAGYSVLEAANGREALDMIRSHHPDLVICDVNMPVLNGFELLEAVRALSGPSANASFIFLTAFGDRDSILTGRKLGADDYLVKPVDFDLLLATVDTRLRNMRRIADQARERVRDLETQVKQLLTRGLPEIPEGRAALLGALESAGSQPGALILVSVDGLHRFAPFVGASRVPALIETFIRLTDYLQADRSARGYRLSAETFAIVLPRPIDEAMVCEARAKWVERTVELDGHVIPVTATVVMASWGRAGGEDHVTTPIERLEDTLLTVRFGQHAGGRTLIVLDNAMRNTVQTSQYVADRLPEALAEGEFFLCFQPKMRLSDRRIVGAEALIRWTSRDRGPISPAVFIPIAERTGQIRLISDWVLESTAQAIRALHAKGLAVPLAVNASGSEIGDRFAERVAACLSAHAIDPHLIEVEVTETSVINDLAPACAVLDALRQQGVSIAIDDFGTGYASFAYLRSLSFDTVKIDQTFIRGIDKGGIDTQIVESVISLARATGRTTVAEGVETALQLERLTAMGCDIAQGYHIAQPMPFSDFREFLKTRNGRAGR